jgi:hypothetical protein
MKLSKASRPSPALVLAALALVFAMVGTAIAGPDAISSKVTTKKVKKIAKKQANKVLDQRESSLNVNSADSAANADNLGGQPPSAYALSDSEAYHEIGAPGEPPFQNGWSNFSATFSSAAFYMDDLGVVHLKGALAGTSGTVAFTLPAGYRPALELFLPLAVGGPAAGNMQVRANGEVELTCVGGCGAAGIDGLSFRAGA